MAVASTAIAALGAPLQPEKGPDGSWQPWHPWTPDKTLVPGPSQICPTSRFNHFVQRLATHPDAQLASAVAAVGGPKKLVEIFESLPPASSCGEMDKSNWKSKAFEKRWPTSSRQGPILDMSSGTTGTRFIDCIFSSLGFRTMHNFKCPDWASDCTSELDATDFVSDSPLPGYIEDAIKAHGDKGFPGMLLTVRDPKEWAISRVKHLPAQSSEYVGSPPCLRQSMYSKGLLHPISDADAVVVPQLITWAYDMCIATSKYKEFPDDHILMLNLFRTDMDEGEKDAHLVKQLTGFLRGPASSIFNRTQLQRLANSVQVNQSIRNCTATFVSTPTTGTRRSAVTTSLELRRPSQNKYDWEWEHAPADAEIMLNETTNLLVLQS